MQPVARPVEVVEATLVTRETAATFSLSSLFLVITLAAVTAGAFAAAPGLGIVFAVVATPALIRAIVVTSRRKTRGVASTRGQKVVTFLGSVGMVLLILSTVAISLTIALFLACTGGLIGMVASNFSGGDKSFMVGAAVGGTIGLAGTFGMVWAILKHLKGRAEI
ncbi:MAG TPA: hypothetical protein VHC22_00510 [Pirellulales bacterium]|nr:hypothetical protein [Pirellulales bacterium]